MKSFLQKLNQPLLNNFSLKTTKTYLLALSRKGSKSRSWLVLLIFLCLIGPVEQTTFRLAQGVLSQIPGLKGFIPPPPEILNFKSLVPGQPFNPNIMKEIGPEGGTVELQNVARLEIPAGALEKVTTVKIIQILQVESNQKIYSSLASDIPDGKILPGYDFITPVVRLEPFGLKLNVAAKLYLPTDATRVGNNDPKLIKKVASETAERETWLYQPYLEPLGTPDAPVQASVQSPIKIKYFLFVAKQFPADIRPDQGVKVSN